MNRSNSSAGCSSDWTASRLPRSARRRRWVRLAPGALCLLALSGCSSGGLSLRMEESLRTEIHDRTPDLADVRIPFQIDAEMRAWLDREVPRSKDDEIQLQRLLEHILEKKDPPFRYRAGFTGTATEVFASGTANCLGFTQMFVGLARELDLPVYFLRVADLQSFERDGDLIVASVHITAAYGPAVSRKIIDFTERPVDGYRRIDPISDITAVALYYSNRGAEELRLARIRPALELLETAVRLDAELAEAWVNLGVARRRTGDAAGAEAAYRAALEADPSIVTAYQNLAALLRSQRRGGEAQDLLALTDRSGNRNPFSYLALGDLSLRQGRNDEAQRFYRRALRLDPMQAESHAAMGDWALRTGNRREAQKHLRKAESLDPANPRVGTLLRQLSAANTKTPANG